MDNKRQANSDASTDPEASSPQSVKRTLSASERRALEAEKRAQMRQQRMRELEEDALKAQVVIAQVKAMSATSLEALAVSSPDGDRKSSASDNELHDCTPPPGLQINQWYKYIRTHKYTIKLTAKQVTTYKTDQPASNAD